MQASSLTKAGILIAHRLMPERYFWAYWPSQETFEKGWCPQTYQVAEMGFSELQLELSSRFPKADWLTISAVQGRDIYRRVRRMELPPDVYKQIMQQLQSKAALRQGFYTGWGFDAADLEDLKRLKKRYRMLVLKYHPDQGGDAEQFMQLQKIYLQACRQLQSRIS